MFTERSTIYYPQGSKEELVARLAKHRNKQQSGNLLTSGTECSLNVRLVFTECSLNISSKVATCSA
jgi:hypothetical protein